MEGLSGHCRHLVHLSEPILHGLDDSHRAVEPIAGVKTAGWLIGHMAVTGDFARKLCGRPPLCPPEWRSLFNPGSQPSTDAAAYPPMAALKERFTSVYEDLAASAPAVPADTLAAPNPYTAAIQIFPTTRDFLSYLMSPHLAYHLGQLSGWRAAAGLARPAKHDA